MQFYRWYFTERYGLELGLTAGLAFLLGVLVTLVVGGLVWLL